jgi:uncharacterized HAD superfamily protein
MMCAIILAELLNKDVATLYDLVAGHTMGCGGRSMLIKKNKSKKVLMVDDTVFNGTSINKYRHLIEMRNFPFKFIYACIFAEGEYAKEMVDIYFEDIYDKDQKLYLYEWNILHHYEHKTKFFMFDMDGVLCKEPPDERRMEEYEAYIKDAVPIVVPTTRVGAIVTYRMEKYRGVTEAWLKRWGIECGELRMCSAADYHQRTLTIRPDVFKGEIYREAKWAQLFIESSAYQAQMINTISGKPVWCYENGVMYDKKN